ncbi:hypothetical protein G7Y89_g6204 [Cudoniella acicularis]|uniref:Uncharacterized protein n=1 Tax=Cudoniella acicularis TaxID=354080 RepID=A0A8H4W2N4_9HELO|nr:hypothetical protein G7Y89_g6204 [Cudoniella acicularis]
MSVTSGWHGVGSDKTNGIMGFWPFRRRSKRKASRSGADIPSSEEGDMHDAGIQRDLVRHDGAEITSSGPERRMSRRDKKRRSSRESKKLKRNPERQRTYSFSPGRDSIKIARDANRPPVPPLPSNYEGNGGRSNTVKQKTSAAIPQPIRSSTQPLEPTQDWQRMPTLHKRSAQELAHRKSSKKRKEDHDREAEIRAMVTFMPTRPAAEHNSSGKLMKRESRKMREGLNRNLQNPSSDISLPMADSLRSSMSSGSEHQTSYKLSAFEMLAPRPTIRYSENPRYVPGASGFGSDRSDSRRRRVSERKTLNEEVLKANQRIDDLADDLSAGELRELMERDQKRREKKKIAEGIKMERRLARRQEKQREAEDAAIRNGTPPPANMERGVLGRELVGLGIETSAVVTSSKRKGSIDSETGRGKRPAESFRQDSATSAQDPFNHFHRSASLATENLTPGSEHSDPVIEMAKLGTVAKASVSPSRSPRGHTRGASSISQLMELSKTEAVSVQNPEKPESSRKSSESSFRAPQSWTSFFKRSKTKRDSAPASFSNTSRDSMQNGPYPPQVGYASVRTQSSIPKRTMSKFREDLPEFPISPPDSRVQSPEADEVPPIRTDYPEKRTGFRASSDDPRIRYDTPTSGYRSLDTMRLQDETPTSGHRSMDAPSPEPTAVLSQSLASIDSEGSWLSGRKGGSKRGSAQLPPQPLHDSVSSIQKRYREFSESAEELGIAEDEYFSRLTPGPEEQYRIHRQSTGNPMPSSDEEEGGSLASPVPSEKTKWGAVARHPTVIHREPRAKSREGLLNDFEDGASFGSSRDSPEPRRKSYGLLNRDVIDEDDPSVHRATSVKRHVRHISAGSARLLDLKPRASGEERRLSSG